VSITSPGLTFDGSTDAAMMSGDDYGFENAAEARTMEVNNTNKVPAIPMIFWFILDEHRFSQKILFAKQN
jgi:hypothetical protein